MASARELRRQQREEGAADEVEGAEEGPGPPRADLSPSSSFRAQRAARGSTFSLWQDIPDVRGSGVLATLSLRDCKLQEVRRGWARGVGGAPGPRVGGRGILATWVPVPRAANCRRCARAWGGGEVGAGGGPGAPRRGQREKAQGAAGPGKES